MVGPAVGGGIQWFLSQRYGTMAENALEFTIVMGNGDVLNANRRENPDLFWLLRGGGIAPGVITQMKYRIYDAPSRVIARTLTQFRGQDEGWGHEEFKEWMSLCGEWFNILHEDGRFDSHAIWNFGFGVGTMCLGDEEECDWDAAKDLFPDQEYLNTGIDISSLFDEEQDF